MIDHPERYIEHTLLKPDISHYHIEKLIEDAFKYGFLGICIPPFWVKKAKRDISNRDLKIVTVAGFPMGFQMTETKMKEAEIAIGDGCDEIDLVWSITAFKAEMIWPKIEIVKIAKLCHEANVLLKVIIETPLLSGSEIIKATKICADAGADFIKTSTGMISGTKPETVELIRKHAPASLGIKASGGINNYSLFEDMINKGADRIGTSSGTAIMEEYKRSN